MCKSVGGIGMRSAQGLDLWQRHGRGEHTHESAEVEMGSGRAMGVGTPKAPGGDDQVKMKEGAYQEGRADRNSRKGSRPCSCQHRRHRKWMVAGRGWVWRQGRGRCCIMASEFQFCKMERILPMVAQLCKHVNTAELSP